MYVLWGDRLMEQTQQPAVGQTPFSSVIINGNNVTSHHFPGHGIRLAQWTQNEAEMKRHYPAMWLALLGSIFLLVLVRLLVGMLNRCPQMIAAALTGIVGTIVVFFILMTLNNKPIYS